ncbi:hypothetical protein GE061_008070, partial [Apolygus lucorum]
MRPGSGVFAVFLVAHLAGCIVEGASFAEMMSSTSSPDAGSTTDSSVNSEMSSTDSSDGYDATKISFPDEPVYEPSESTTETTDATTEASDATPDATTIATSDESPDAS